MTTVEDFQDAEEDEWRIEWENNEPSERNTTLAAIAYYASEYDDGATVIAVTNGS